MNELALPTALPATPEGVLREICAFEEFALQLPQEDVPTEHLFHAGMYLRTIRMAPGVVLTGALLKRATAVIVSGMAWMLAGEERVCLDGYNVLAGSVGRKQVFISVSDVAITMVLPTQAKTVEEAEAECTDDAARLLSRRQDGNTVAITGE